MECLELSTSEVRRYRSRAEKQQIIEEASAPGASVAEVARQHDVNANLVFKWLRDARRSSDVERPPEAVRIEPARALEFVPLGVFTRGDETGGGAVSLPVPSPAPGLSPLHSTRPSAPKLEERAGVIEIDLPGGARVRVDAFVNQGALRRVLQAMREPS
jgi:transposase